MEKRILQTIQDNDLVQAGDHLLVAVSGGADSVALLHGLIALRDELKIGLSIGHLNHQLRGSDSDEDARFVEELSKQLGLPVVVGSEDVSGLAKRTGESLEMAGRAARYGFFAEVAQTMGASTVATGHTWNDQAETVLMRLCQGGGNRGLRGIPYQMLHGEMNVVRPLRDCRREEIVPYLREKGQFFREDASNRDPAFLRNRFRHEIIPLLESMLPSVQDALVRSAELADTEFEWLDQQAQAWLADQSIGDGWSASGLTHLPVALQRAVVRRWLAGQAGTVDGAGYAVVEAIRELTASVDGSREVHIPGWRRVIREYDRVTLEDGAIPTAVGLSSTDLLIPGTTEIADLNLTVTATEAAGLRKPVAGRLGDYPAMACIRREGADALCVRSWEPGDRLWPTGMDGSRKLQDVFVDLKVPLRERSRIPVVASGGDIVWLPGYRVDRRWALQSADEPCYELRISRNPVSL